MEGRARPRPSKGGTLKVVVQPDAEFESLQDLLKRLGELQGCTPCGLGGFDVLLRGEKVSRPGVIREVEGIMPDLQGISGIADVSIEGFR